MQYWQADFRGLDRSESTPRPTSTKLLRTGSETDVTTLKFHGWKQHIAAEVKEYSEDILFRLRDHFAQARDF